MNKNKSTMPQHPELNITQDQKHKKKNLETGLEKGQLNDTRACQICFCTTVQSRTRAYKIIFY
jgi:hypothetical protein